MHGEKDTLLALFAQTEIFIFVFVEIVSKITPVKHVILKIGDWKDKFWYILLFGAFSIMGTSLGIPLDEGVIANIRDFAPMLAGLTAGPFVGLCVGLIGGFHRLTMGGLTTVPCALSTMLAGLIFGYIHILNKGKLIGIIPAMALAVLMELLHGTITMLIVKPWEAVWPAVSTAIPAMMVANSLGMAIGVILTSREIKEHKLFHKVEKNTDI